MNITAGKFKGRKVSAPYEQLTRPTLSKVRMSVFNTLQSMIEFDGAGFLDMFAGSGIMALEALSRGFSYAAAIEKHPKVIRVIKSNYKNFSPAPLLIHGDSLKAAEVLDRKFDVIYIDPPYYAGVYEAALEAVKSIACGIVILEHVTEVDFSGFDILKQKEYGGKVITYLKAE